MNKTEADMFKNLFKNILIEKGSLQSLSNDVTYTGGDEVDVLNFNQEKELKSKMVNRNSRYLKKVKYALDKIENQTFGVCEECDGEIGAKRLKARPTATMCISCKEASEKIEHNTFDKTNVVNLPNRNISIEADAENDPFRKNVKKLDSGEIRVLV